MIFLTLGTQKFQFNRLLKYVDELIENGDIKEEVFAQIGNSSYIPKNFKYVKFLNSSEFNNYILNCSFFITHGGVGSIQQALLNKKKTLVCPRVKKYHEHVDNHQEQLVNKYEKLGYIKSFNSKEELKDLINNISNLKFNYFLIKNEDNNEIVNYIDEFIQKGGKL